MNFIYLLLACIYLLCGLGGSLIIHRRFFSPLAVFSGIFGSIFLLLSIPLVDYRSLSTKTILILISTLLSLILGSFLGPLLTWSLKKSRSKANKSLLYYTTSIREWLLFSNLMSTFGIIIQFYFIIRLFGGVSSYINNVGNIYMMRVEGDIAMPQWASYLGTISYAASFVGGCYLAINGRYRILSIWPLLNTFMLSFLIMGRASMLWGTTYFFTGYILTSIQEKRFLLKITRSNLIKWGKVVLFVVLILLVTILLRQIRGGNDNFWPSVAKIAPYTNLNIGKDKLFLNSLLSNYIYVTGSVPTLGYLVDNNSYLNWRIRLFAPIFRLFGISNSRYSDFVAIPFSFNVYTAIAEWYLGFGWWGTLCVFFVIGFLSSVQYEKVLKGSCGFKGLAILGLLLLWLEWSWVFSFTRQGLFWIALVWLFLGGYWIETKFVYRGGKL